MKIWVLDNILVATERSRRDLSIGEIKFDVRIDYPSQKTLQSIGFIKFLEGPGPYLKTTQPLEAPWKSQKTRNRDFPAA